MLEQLKKEQAEELEKVQRHLEAAEQGLRELEDNLRVLQKASTTCDSDIMTEVRAHQENNTRMQITVSLFTRLIFFLTRLFSIHPSLAAAAEVRVHSTGGTDR